MAKAAQAREMLKMTDREIAARCGVSERAVRKWGEGGGMRARTRARLAALLIERGARLQALGEQLQEER